MPDSANVRVALSGGVLRAPIDTPAPADPSAAWGAGWVNLGFISEDGVTEAYDDDTETIRSWQGGQTVRSMITGTTATFGFTCIETNIEVLRAYHKGSEIVSTADLATINVGGATADQTAWGFDILDGDDHIRIIVGRGEVTERGEITYRSNEAIGYQLTITAYPDADGLTAVKLSNAAGLLTPAP